MLNQETVHNTNVIMRIDSCPMDTEPDNDYDLERPGSRHRHRRTRNFRPYVMKTRKNDGNNDYISIPFIGPENRGCAAVHCVMVVLVAFTLALTIQPIITDPSFYNNTEPVGMTNNGTFPANVSVDPGLIKPGNVTTSTLAPYPYPYTGDPTEENPGLIKPGNLTTSTLAPSPSPYTGDPTEENTKSSIPLHQNSNTRTNSGGGPKKGGNIVQRRCSIGHQTPLERSKATMQNYKIALEAGFGNCGPHGEQHTSLTRTVEQFSDTAMDYDDSEAGWMWLDTGTKAVGVRHVSLPFRAVGNDGTPRTVGGDEFVLTFRGQTTPSKSIGYESVVVKTAVVAQDRGDGMYDAFLAIPDVPFKNMSMTLSHYYGCYQGFFPDNESPETSDYLKLEVGPKDVVAHEDFNKLVLAVDRDEDYSWWSEDLPEKIEGIDRRWLSVPVCEASQIGMDGLTNGIWSERLKKGDVLVDISTDAVWLPLCCRSPTSAKTDLNPIRIGDSAMPQPTLKVGDVYDVLKPFHNQWIDYLANLHEKYGADHRAVESDDDVLVLSAGLDYIRSGYNPQTAAELVTRMLCQITLLYPGKVLWTGSIPVQQHLDSKVEVTDQNVRLLDAVLRQRVEKAGGRLDGVCKNSDVDALFGFVNAKDGSARIKGYVTHHFQKLKKEGGNGADGLAHSENYMNLDWALKKISTANRQKAWGDRKVVYVDVDRFLRPRPEEEEKEAHDVKPVVHRRPILTKGPHEKLFMNMIQMRHVDKDM